MSFGSRFPALKRPGDEAIALAEQQMPSRRSDRHSKRCCLAFLFSSVELAGRSHNNRSNEIYLQDSIISYTLNYSHSNEADELDELSCVMLVVSLPAQSWGFKRPSRVSARAKYSVYKLLARATRKSRHRGGRSFDQDTLGTST